jgi:DNA-binding beta-propeller fold protein YncE
MAFSGATAQNLADAYKNGTVTLQEDPLYGAGNNWNQVFNIPVVQDKDEAVKPRKSLVVADDGTAFVCNYDSYTIQKFDPSGKFVKTFGQEGSGNGQFRNRPTLHGVLDNRYVFTGEHNGRLTFFDLNGQFVKILKLDYMPLQCIPLRDDKIAIVGSVAWSGARMRHIVSIKDVATGEENIVCSKVTESIGYGVLTVKTDKGYCSLGGGGKSVGWVIARTAEGNLVASYTDDPTIEVFSPEGNRLSQFTMTIDRIMYPESERNQYGVKIRDLCSKMGASEQDVQKAIDSVKYPDFLPYTYNILVDNDGNLLAFTYTDTQVGHRFQAYRLSPAGQVIGKVDLLSDRYELNLNPSAGTIQFANGYLYAVVIPKDAVDGPAQLIRGKLVAK